MGKNKAQKNTGAKPKQFTSQKQEFEIQEPEPVTSVASPGDRKLQKQREKDERDAKLAEELKKANAEKAKQEAKKSGAKKKNKKPATQLESTGSLLENMEIEKFRNQSGTWNQETVPAQEFQESVKVNTDYSYQEPRKNSFKLNRNNTYNESNQTSENSNTSKWGFGDKTSWRDNSSAYSATDSRFDKRNDNRFGKSYQQNYNYSPSPYSGGRGDKRYEEFMNLCNERNPINYNKIVTEKGDLFAAPEEYALAHCVAEDMAMGAGIARTFRTDFGRVGELLNQRQQKGGLAFLNHEGRFIYYLVTKEISRGKPTYHTLWQSLNKLKDHMRENEVKKLAIPQIGCGLDRLEWYKVEQMIEHIFRDENVEIKVYIWDESVEATAPAKKILKKCVTVHKVMDILNIESQTGLVYFGFADGYETEEFKHLATRYNISGSYKRPKSITDVIKTIDKTEYIYGLIIKNSYHDEIDYSVVEKAIFNLKKLMRADKTIYVAFQAFVDEKDRNLFYKIIALMQYIFFDVEIWICYPENLKDICPQQSKISH